MFDGTKFLDKLEPRDGRLQHFVGETVKQPPLIRGSHPNQGAVVGSLGDTHAGVREFR